MAHSSQCRCDAVTIASPTKAFHQEVVRNAARRARPASTPAVNGNPPVWKGSSVLPSPETKARGGHSGAKQRAFTHGAALFALGAKSKKGMSTHPHGVPPTHVTHIPLPTNAYVSPFWEKFWARLNFGKSRGKSAMLPGNVIAIQSESTSPSRGANLREMSNKAFDDMSLGEQKAHLLRQSEEIDRQAKTAKRRDSA